jgi:hypothetical protein
MKPITIATRIHLLANGVLCLLLFSYLDPWIDLSTLMLVGLVSVVVSLPALLLVWAALSWLKGMKAAPSAKWAAILVIAFLIPFLPAFFYCIYTDELDLLIRNPILWRVEAAALVATLLQCLPLDRMFQKQDDEPEFILD